MPTSRVPSRPHGPAAVAAGPARPGTSADAQRLPLALRVPSAVLTSSVLSVGAHAVAGSPLPSLTSVALVACLYTVLWGLAARRELALGRLVGLVWTAQLVGHLVFATSHQHLAHQHLAAASPAASVEPDPAGWGGGGSLVAHLVAGLVVAWWLRRGERHAWHVARRSAARALRIVVAVVPAVPSEPGSSRPVRRRVLALHSEIEPACPLRRGPPSRLALP